MELKSPSCWLSKKPGMILEASTWSDGKTNLVLEIPKDVVGRLRRSDEACYGVGGTNIQENLLLPLNLTRRL